MDVAVKVVKSEKKPAKKRARSGCKKVRISDAEVALVCTSPEALAAEVERMGGSKPKAKAKAKAAAARVMMM